MPLPFYEFFIIANTTLLSNPPVQPISGTLQMHITLTLMAISCVMTGKNLKNTHVSTTTPSMHALAAKVPSMVLSIALEHSHTSTPITYKLIAWKDFLAQASLLLKYPDIVEGILHGFSAHMPLLLQTFVVPNHPSVM